MSKVQTLSLQLVATLKTGESGALDFGRWTFGSSQILMKEIDDPTVITLTRLARSRRQFDSG